MLQVKNLQLNLDETLMEGENLKKKIAKKLRVLEEEIKGMRILKESVDARKKNNILINYQVLVSIKNEDKVLSKGIENVSKHFEREEREFTFGNQKMENRPIIIGFGPSGMFAAYNLAKNGYRPIVFEMGEDVDKRQASIDEFWKSGKLNTKSNVQFGEGGAGTFSDGKLTTRIKDERVEDVLDILVNNGAPEEIKYRNKPHVGTDILREVVKNIRKEIIKMGGDVYFSHELSDIKIKDKRLAHIEVNGNDYPCSDLILAIGHSSRNTYEMIYNKGFMVEAKAFAMGYRIEHKQTFIDEAQYGAFINHPKLRKSEYSLAVKLSNQRGVYSFCMCPGGVVVNASSEEGMLAVNGMSYHARDKENANSAIVITINEKYYDKNDPLSGMKLQRESERNAFISGGGDFTSPVETVEHFLGESSKNKIGNVEPSIKKGYKLTSLDEIYPNEITNGLKEGLTLMNKKIKGFKENGAILTGAETRTSAPIRILRNENLESINIKGIYPIGEGAGYAGGIVSAAVDGIKVSEIIMKKYSPFL